jgi:hypothetical protein
LGKLFSLAGLLPLRLFDERIRLTRALDALDDARDPHLTEHTLVETVRARVYGIPTDHEDQNARRSLRSDAAFRLLIDRSFEDDDLASETTLSCFENAFKFNLLKSLCDKAFTGSMTEGRTGAT